MFGFAQGIDNFHLKVAHFSVFREILENLLLCLGIGDEVEQVAFEQPVRRRFEKTGSRYIEIFQLEVAIGDQDGFTGMLKYCAIFPFAGSQCFQDSGAGKGIPDGSIEIFTADLRFKEVVSGTQLHCLVIDRAVSFTGQENERLFASLEKRVAQEVQTRLGTEAIVDKIQVVLLLPDQLQRFVIMPALVDKKVLIRNSLDVLADDEDVGVVVVDNQDPDGGTQVVHRAQAD